jgi:cytochrome c biogenesis protein ResB
MVHRLFRMLGSLPMALALLPTFALILALGTYVESFAGSHVAQQLVYQTWWFVALLGLIGINIFFAAIKKWPWKRHQTGFLITHVGLLLLVAGGVVTSIGGVHGSMALVDSDDTRYRPFGLSATNLILEPR